MIDSNLSKRRFSIGIVILFLLSAFLRFWGLSRFNTLVFDEVHFVKFANNYLIEQPFLENHPPLGKYLIAIGIWLSQLTPLAQGDSNTLAGSPLTPWSYRWMNALIGSFIPLIIAGIAYELSKRRSYALMAGGLAAIDGLFLVESRYGLINIYLVLFGLLGQWLFLLALSCSAKQRRKYLSLASVCFGASFSVKWSGLTFLLGVYGLWILSKMINALPRRKVVRADRDSSSSSAVLSSKTPLKSLAQLKLIDLIVGLGIIPVIVYCLFWIPHLQLNTNMGFWQWQNYLYVSQKSVGSNIHPYCSNWYSWIWMRRPVGYYFEIVKQPSKKIPGLDPLLPQTPKTEIYYDVHGMGNPVLWWLATIAIVLLAGLLIQKVVLLSSNLIPNQNKVELRESPNFWIPLYLVTNYGANLFPWIAVTRCTFLYHYMGASVFSLLAIAWIVDNYLCSRRLALKFVGVIAIYLNVISFLYWLPIYWGLPLNSGEFHGRMWFRSWY